MYSFDSTFIELLVLLAISISVIAIAKKTGIPYSILLVVAGLLLGVAHIPPIEEAKAFITQSHIFQGIIISLFLPILLGDATLKMPWRHLREQAKPVAALAIGGTLLSFLVIALLSYYLLGLSLPVAFTFGALMSATDPISVISIFKSLGVPKAVVTVIEGESLLNDGIAVVLFQISSVYLFTYMEMGWAGIGRGLLLFLQFGLGGAALGAVLGYLFSQLIRLYDDYPLEIAFSMLLFFGSYFIAEHLHVSGVIAVVTAGLIFGNYGARVGMSEKTEMNINSFWDVITLIANSLIFLMIGLEIRQVNFHGKWLIIISAVVLVLIGRTIALYVSTFPLKGFPSAWKIILNWGGLKGSLSLALALSLPLSFEGRSEVLALTFSIVLFSLLVQGLTIKPLVLRLKLNKSRGE